MFKWSGAQNAPPEPAFRKPALLERAGEPDRLSDRFVDLPATRPDIVSTDPFSAHANDRNRSSDNDGQLSVGPDIELNGAISSCRKLIVEGRVEGEIDAGELVIGERGTVSGTVRVTSADIEGAFSGELVIEGDLSIRSNGRVDGKIRYGRLMIESGGQITGDIQVVAEGSGESEAAETKTADTAPPVSDSGETPGPSELENASTS